MSLIARYKLDGNALDSSGNGHHGTPVGVDTVAGLYSDCYEFVPANGDYITQTSVLPDSSLKLSIAVWAYISSTGMIIESSTNFNDNGGAFIIYADVANNRMAVNMKPILPFYAGHRFSNFTEWNKWVHLVAIYDGEIGDTFLYVNGVQHTDTDYTWDDSVGPLLGYDIFIGSRGLGVSDILGGKLQDMQIYDHILTPKEIDEIYHTPIVHLDFNNEKVNGETITDLSGWDNHAILDANAPTHNTIDQQVGSGCYELSGTNDIQLEPTNLNIYNKGTLSFRIKVNGDAPNGYHAIYQRYSKPSAYEGHQFYIYNDGRVGIYTNTVNTFNYTLTDREWHHYVAVFDGDKIHCYVDGEFVNTLTSVVFYDVPNADAEHNFGNFNNTAYANALLDDPRIYPFALSAEKVKELYQTKAEIDTNGDFYVRGGVETLASSITYATFNPDDKTAGVTLSNNNLTASIYRGVSEPLDQSIRCTQPRSSGKWYVEFLVGEENGIGGLGFGISSTDIPITQRWSTTTEMLGYYGYYGSLYHNGLIQTNSEYIFHTGDIIGLNIDIDTKKIIFTKNGTSTFGEYDFSSMVGQEILLLCGNDTQSGPFESELRTDPILQTYSPEVGYTAGWPDVTPFVDPRTDKVNMIPSTLWSGVSTITPNLLGPDGLLSATKLQATTSNSYAWIRNIPLLANEHVTYSFYVKTSENVDVRASLGNSGADYMLPATGLYVDGKAYADGMQIGNHSEWTLIEVEQWPSTNLTSSTAGHAWIGLFNTFSTPEEILVALPMVYVGSPVTEEPTPIKPMQIDITKQGNLQLTDGDISEVGITDGLIGYWPLNGDTKDYSGKNLHLSVKTGALNFTQGLKTKKCVTTDTMLSLESVRTLILPTSGMTLSSWVNIDRYGTYGTTQIFFDNINNPTNSVFFNIDGGAGYTAFAAGYAPSSYVTDHFPHDLLGNWHHITQVLDLDLNMYYSYVDGVLMSSAVFNITYLTDPHIVGLCNALNNNYRPLYGEMQDVRLYDRALSPEDIAVQYSLFNPNINCDLQQHNNIIYVPGQFKEMY